MADETNRLLALATAHLEDFSAKSGRFLSQMQKMPLPEREQILIQPELVIATWDEVHERIRTQLHPERPAGWYAQRAHNRLVQPLLDDRETWMTMAERLVDVIVDFVSMHQLKGAEKKRADLMVEQIKLRIKEAKDVSNAATAQYADTRPAGSVAGATPGVDFPLAEDAFTVAENAKRGTAGHE